jgi:hypothetical protein
MLEMLQHAPAGMQTTRVAQHFGIDRRTARQHLHTLSINGHIEPIRNCKGVITWHAKQLLVNRASLDEIESLESKQATRERIDQNDMDEPPFTHKRTPVGAWTCGPITCPTNVFDLARS